MAVEKVVVSEKLGLFSDHWNPRIVAELNGQLVKLAKLKGEFIWHKHDAEDELFYVISGQLKIELRDKTLVLNPGEMVVIPRGVEHKPVADEEVSVMLFEPKETLNTGDTESELTQKELDRI
ncbi:cupin domain-containing protein [bacterium SCSIO 12741]|nr:cupin domain-containing protein [bacterium SCSIO 12741]